MQAVWRERVRVNAAIRLSLLSCLLILACLPSGCAPARSEAHAPRPDSLETKVAGLEREAISLEQRLIRLEMARSQYDEVTIDPSTKSFQRLDSTVGVLLVSCQDVQPYANGFKVHLSIGNVTMATLHGFKLKVSWGPAYTDTTVTDWTTARHSGEFDFTDDLLPGKWNKVAFALTPAQPRDLDYVSVGMESNTVSLWK